MELTDEEKQIIVEALRSQEGSSRRSFGKWMADNTQLIGEERWTTRVDGATKAWKRLVELRAKFDDLKPVDTKN